jgi:hypothetical protein
MHTTEEDLRNKIQTRAGIDAIAPALFYVPRDGRKRPRRLQKLRPRNPRSIPVRALVYDVTTGLLRGIRDA